MRKALLVKLLLQIKTQFKREEMVKTAGGQFD